MGEMLGGIRAVLPNSDAHLTWVDAAFLEESKVRPWSDMPVWVPARGGTSSGFSRRSIDRALARGLTFRPLADTVRDTLAYYAQQPEARRAQLRAGLAAEREREVLAAWKPVAASRQKA
jgi:2'-hydroxyisoflavone reductase